MVATINTVDSWSLVRSLDPFHRGNGCYAHGTVGVEVSVDFQSAFHRGSNERIVSAIESPQRVLQLATAVSLHAFAQRNVRYTPSS